MNLDKITLPGKCILVRRDEPLKQTASGIFLGENPTEIMDIGEIVKIGLGLASEGFLNLVGSKIRFKEVFAEPLQIEGKNYLFFRELEPSIYYFIGS